MSLKPEQIKNLLEQRKATGENEILYRVQLTGNHMPGMLEVVVDGIARFFASTDDMYLPPTPPKYDPCRPFKKGDIVEPVACNGRAPLYLRKYIGTKQVVECDEDINGIVGIVGDVEAVSAAFLKLITPIEELKPYSVGETTDYFSVDKDDEELSLYWKDKHPHAKESAEAERDRLNDEYRKEQE